MGLEHLGDRARCDPVPETQELTLNALVAPGWVVRRHPHDEQGQLVGDGRTTEVAVRTGPEPGHQATVPAKESLGGAHAER